MIDNHTIYGLKKLIPTSTEDCEQIIINTQKFLLAIRNIGVKWPADGYVTISPYGTTVIDLNVNRGLISIEIGKTKIGFFTDYEDGINEESDGIVVTDFTSIPEKLVKHFGLILKISKNFI